MKAEAAKLPGVGILPKQRPSKERWKRGKCTVSVHSGTLLLRDAQGEERQPRFARSGIV